MQTHAHLDIKILEEERLRSSQLPPPPHPATPHLTPPYPLTLCYVICRTPKSPIKQWPRPQEEAGVALVCVCGEEEERGGGVLKAHRPHPLNHTVLLWRAEGRGSHGDVEEMEGAGGETKELSGQK